MAMPDESRVLVFDLDDTLYLERDFAYSGFTAAEAWLKKEMGIDGLAGHCRTLFSSGKRTRVFDEALEILEMSGRDDLVAALIAIYRNHSPQIALAADALRYLQRPSGRRAVITDGNAATQRAKVKALDLDRFVDLVIYTDAWGRPYWKPHSRAFETIQDWAEVAPSQLVYVADNPLKDFVTPRSLGWTTVRIARSERVHLELAPDLDHEAHAEIADLDALDDCLAALSRGPG